MTPEMTAKVASTMRKTSHIVTLVIGVLQHGGSGLFSWSQRTIGFQEREYHKSFQPIEPDWNSRRICGSGHWAI
jgi:cytoskeletal protein RodZ